MSGRSNLVRRKSCLTEHEAKKVLKEYGIPTTREILCQDESAVLKAAKKIGYPIVLKIASPKILHKSDVGGVILNILDSKRLQESIKSLRSFPLLVQEMIKDGQEVIIGGRRDETFGPVIIFGLGGIFTELLKDFSIRVCPVTKMDVKEMIEEIRGNQILKGYRGKEKVNLDAIINTIIKVSNLLLNNTQIKEFDINPAIVDSKRLVVVDARVILFS